MTMDDAMIELSNRFNKVVDPYGLYKQVGVINGNVEYTVTNFDSFLLEDSLRYANTQNLTEIKKAMASRFNNTNGLFDVTAEDCIKNQEYYMFATMFNRMTDTIYAAKVGRCSILIKDMVSNIKRDYLSSISSAITSHGYDESISNDSHTI
jgi:hypothetical protein